MKSGHFPLFRTVSFFKFDLFLTCFPKNVHIMLRLNCNTQIMIELLSFSFIMILDQSVFDFLLMHVEAAACLLRKDCGGAAAEYV